MNIKIIQMPIDQLKVNPDNPRMIRDKGFKRLVESLTGCPELFQVRPCICSNRTGENIILGGNMRFEAAKKIGYTEVPCIIMDNLTEEQEREITIKDNGTEFGEWDFDLLSGWDDLPLIDWGVDLPNYDENDIDAEWTGMPECENEDKTAFRDIIIHFKDHDAVNEFAETIKHTITPKTKYIWYPEIEIEKYMDKGYIDES